MKECNTVSFLSNAFFSNNFDDSGEKHQHTFTLEFVYIVFSSMAIAFQWIGNRTGKMQCCSTFTLNACMSNNYKFDSKYQANDL